MGNPGPAYTKTRHNIGRRAVETLGRESRANWKKDRSLKAQWARLDEEKDPFLIAFPGLFMNESGEAVRRLVAHFKVRFQSDLLVVVDDAALPFGRLRLRAKGTDGGHRGLRSIEQALGSREYARLRFGIAPESPVGIPLEEYVLDPFKAAEERRLPALLEQCLQACRLWLSGPLAKAMDWANKLHEASAP